MSNWYEINRLWLQEEYEFKQASDGRFFHSKRQLMITHMLVETTPPFDFRRCIARTILAQDNANA